MLEEFKVDPLNHISQGHISPPIYYHISQGQMSPSEYHISPPEYPRTMHHPLYTSPPPLHTRFILSQPAIHDSLCLYIRMGSREQEVVARVLHRNARGVQGLTHTPTPHTLHPYTLHPIYTLHTTPHTRHTARHTLHATRESATSKCSRSSRSHSTLISDQSNSRHASLNPQPWNLDPEPSTSTSTLP